MVSIAVIGGGASGLICAARLAYLLREDRAYAPLGVDSGEDPGVRIVVLEGSSKLGRPILRSGNGRCNISNADIDVSRYHNGGFARDVFANADRVCEDERMLIEGSVLSADIAFFANRGLALREESEGRLYPYPNKAECVRDLLLRALEGDEGYPSIDIRVDAEAMNVRQARHDGAFEIGFADGSSEAFDRVVMASGGDTVGHVVSSEMSPHLDLAPCRPMLCPLEVAPRITKRLDGVRVRCEASLHRDSEKVREGSGSFAVEKGEVLFRRFGLSGIAIFNISRYAQPGDQLVLDLVPERTYEDLAPDLEKRARVLSVTMGSHPTNLDVLQGLILEEVALEALAKQGADARAPFSDAWPLVDALKEMSFEVVGPADTERAQVKRGGVGASALDPKTMRVRAIPGLYVTGEAIDVDGPCGGYNLHFAWMSGLLAASSIASEVLDEEGSTDGDPA